MIDIIVSIIVTLSIVVRGSYFPNVYIGISIILFLTMIYTVYIHRQLDKIAYATLIMVLLYGVSILYSVYSKNNAIIEFLKWPSVLSIYIIVKNMNDKDYFIKGIYNGCLISAILGILNYFELFNMGGALLDINGVKRMQSVFQYANICASFMIIGYYASNYFMEKNKNDKKYMNVIAYIFLISLFLTKSRGAIICFCVLTIVQIYYYIKCNNSKYINTSMQIILAILVVLIIDKFSNNISMIVFLISIIMSYILYKYTYKSKIKINLKYYIAFVALCTAGSIIYMVLNFNNYGTMIERLVAMKDSLNIVYRYPFGIGPDNYSSIIYQFRSSDYYMRYIHNGYLQIAMDSGIINLFLFIGIFYKVIENAIPKLNNENVYLIFSIIYIMLHAFVDVDFSFLAILIVLWGYYGYLYKIKNKIEE